MPSAASGASSVVPHAIRSAAALLRAPLYRRAVLGYCAYTFAIGGFAYWAPTFVYRQFGLEVGRASVRFGTITVFAGLVGTLAGGILADSLARRRSSSARSPKVPDAPEAAGLRASLWVCAASAGLGAPLAAAALWAGTADRFFLLVVPCEIALFLSSGPVNVVLLRSAPAGLRASAMAFGIFSIHLFGDMWSQPLIGLVADHASWGSAMLAVPVFFAMASFVWWRASGRLT
jgi:hypothetical protein